jgi:hypothetical protein
MAQIGYPSLYQRHVGGIGAIVASSVPTLLFSKKFKLTLSTKINLDLSLNRSKQFDLKINRSE